MNVKKRLYGTSDRLFDLEAKTRSALHCPLSCFLATGCPKKKTFFLFPTCLNIQCGTQRIRINQGGGFDFPSRSTLFFTFNCSTFGNPSKSAIGAPDPALVPPSPSLPHARYGRISTPLGRRVRDTCHRRAVSEPKPQRGGVKGGGIAGGATVR